MASDALKEQGRAANGCFCLLTWGLGVVALSMSSEDSMLVLAGAILCAGAIIADAISLQVRR